MNICLIIMNVVEELGGGRCGSSSGSSGSSSSKSNNGISLFEFVSDWGCVIVPDWGCVIVPASSDPCPLDFFN